MTRIIKHLLVALFCFFLFSLGAMSQPSQNLTDCNKEPDAYQSNRNTVLSTLRNRSSLGSYYSNATAGLKPNTVYGMFLCIGNISKTSCSDCVHSATSGIAETCESHDSSFIFSGDCMVRYSDVSFYSLVEASPSTSSYAPINSSDSPKFFNKTLPGKIDELVLKVPSSSSSPIPYFVEDQEHVSQLEGSYDIEAMAQCSPDLDPRNCTVCLELVVQQFSECCSQSRWARILFPKCLLRYNISALQPTITSLGVRKGDFIFGITFIAIMIALLMGL
ncbi:PREDICTED: probable cysteine-rich repeat secretory protein 6 [Camelina sativa]|uniref:Probable cysteine-rich repeat secretory protein 6 n=1 Tax=Camelina sativa TaxID=90675 RepID=A0ABM0SZH2_CAMSA|nr:PREDICTED: probable cysteine-rich repeat secretory protein 6 [Camelina sativa]